MMVILMMKWKAMMNKKLLILIIALNSNTGIFSSSNCTTTSTQKGYLKKVHSSKKVYCTCPCSGPRADDNTCYECGHKVVSNHYST